MFGCWCKHVPYYSLLHFSLLLSVRFVCVLFGCFSLCVLNHHQSINHPCAYASSFYFVVGQNIFVPTSLSCFLWCVFVVFKISFSLSWYPLMLLSLFCSSTPCCTVCVSCVISRHVLSEIAVHLFRGGPSIPSILTN